MRLRRNVALTVALLDQCQRGVIGQTDIACRRGGELQIFEQAVVQAVDPAVHHHTLVSAPGVANDGGAADVAGLLQHVQLHQCIDLQTAVQAGQEALVGIAHVLHVAQPVVDQACALIVQRRAHAAAVAVADDDDVLDLEDPHNLQEIVESVNKIGEIIEKKDEAKKITELLKKRIKYIKNTTPKIKLKVLAIEWIEPFFTAGHWVPEMIKDAGGENMISKIGEHSRKLSIDEIIKSDPDIIIMMPCGFDTFRTISEYTNILKDNKSWNMLRAVKNKNIFAVDANSYFSKPSIRAITGLEILAKIIQPESFLNLKIPENSFLQIK